MGAVDVFKAPNTAAGRTTFNEREAGPYTK
jgi:hypothetical protein